MELGLEKVAAKGVNSTVAQWEVEGIHVIGPLNQNPAVTETSASRRILCKRGLVLYQKEYQVLFVNVSCSKSIFVSEIA